MLAYRPRRWLVHLALAFGAGVYLGGGVAFIWLWPGTAALCALCAVLLRRMGKSLYLPLLALAVTLGLIRCSLSAYPVLPEEGSYQLTAVIASAPRVREKDGRVSVYLRDVRLPGDKHAYQAYWTYWPREADAPLPTEGQTASFSGRVYHPSGQVNPHGFDFRMYLLQKGVELGVTGCDGLTLTPGDVPLLSRWRQAIRQRLDELLGEQSSLAAALLLDDKSDLPEDVAEDFRTAGVAHVLTVSGLHVMILFSCILLLLRRFSPSQRAVLLMGILLLGAYALLVGARASVLRAGLLMIYLQLGRMARRHRDPLTALAAAFLCILALRPLELFAAGFQMSFSAVLGLILLKDALNRGLRKLRHPLLRRLLDLYGGTLCASLAASFPVAWYYHRLSLVGLLVSPAVVAAVTLLLPLLIGLLLLSIPLLSVARVLGRAVALLCSALSGFVQACASLPFANFLIRRLPFYVLAAAVLCLVLCTRYVLLRRGKRLLLGLGALALSVGLMLVLQNRDVRYIQLSEGSADAAIIEDGSQTLLIDVAEYGGDVAGYLLSEGRRANYVLLSHLHSDHALGLSELLRQGVPIDGVYLSTEARTTPVTESVLETLRQAEAQGIPLYYLSAGDHLALDRVSVEVLWPDSGGAAPGGDPNDFAMALLIDLDGVSMLHMSDVSGAFEMQAARPAQVLRVAHHGSASSTGQRFLEAVRPDAALISTRQASEKTLSRLAEEGAMIYDTNEHGALTLTVRHGQAWIQGFLQ